MSDPDTPPPTPSATAEPPTEPTAEPTAEPPAAGDPPAVSSRALMGNGRRLLIEHAGEVYTLQITRQNKLLLTK